MTISRRSFLKALGIGAIATVAAPQIITQATAPLFIPAERLDFGVPRPILVLPDAKELTSDAVKALADQIRREQAALAPVGTIPMTILQTTFSSPHGGRLWEGSTVLVDEATAGRWVDYGIAAPEQGYHVEPDTTRRVLEAAQMQRARKNGPRMPSFEAKFRSREPDAVDLQFSETLREQLRLLADAPEGASWGSKGSEGLRA